MKFTKKLLSLLLAAAMLFSITTGIDLSAYASSYYEAESNNSYSTANSFPVNSTIYGVCTNSNDNDWYKFTLSERGRIDFTFSFPRTDSSGSWYVSIYKSTGSGNYSELDGNYIYLYDGSCSYSTLGLDAGTYFIKVDPDSKVAGIQYGVTVNYTRCNNWEVEFNNGYSTADTLTLNSTMYGVCTNSNDNDWYKFTLSERGRIDFTFSFPRTDSSGSWYVSIYKSTGSGNYSELDGNYIYLYDGSCSYSTLGLDAGTYFIKVDPDSKVAGIQYGVTVNYTRCNNWEVEFNNGYSTADTLTLNTTMYGVCTDSNDYDWYKFTLPSKEKINVSFSFSKASSQGYWRVSIYKYTGSGNYSELHSKAIYRSDGTYRFSTLGLEAGTYFIKVDPDSKVAGIQYGVTVSNNKLSTPKLQTAVNSNGSFKLSWNKVSGATRYGIYMLQTNGAYKWIKSTSATSWTTGTAQYGKKYTYKIIAVNDNSAVKSAYSNAVSVTNNKKLQSTTAKVTVNANGSFKLSWNKVAGATKYGIYMKQDDGSYKWIKTVTGTSWSTGIAQYGKQYSYKVLVANNNKSAQTFSNVVNAKNNKKLQTPTAKITVNANGSFTISWNKIAGATKYGIYLKQADGSYKWIKTVTAGTSFRTAVAPKGKTYSYKVFAANNNSSANSAFSNVVSAKRK